LLGGLFKSLSLFPEAGWFMQTGFERDLTGPVRAGASNRRFSPIKPTWRSSSIAFLAAQDQFLGSGA